MPLVSIIMLIAAIPIGILDIIFNVVEYPISITILFNAALIISYLMVFSMAWILGFSTEVFLETLKDEFKNKF